MPRVTADLAYAGVGVPAHAHPLVAPDEWAELARPGTPVHWVALDLGGGPAGRPDPYLASAARRLRAAGVRLLGRLDAGHGTRPFGRLVGEAHHLMEWYGVDGFHLDRAPADRDGLAGCREVARTLAAMTDGGGHLVLGCGRYPDPGYAEIADQLVTYLGPWTRYRWSQAPEWTAEFPAERFCHLVHGVPRPHLETALRIARWQGAGTVFLTDRDGAVQADPWAGLPTYWAQMSRILRDRSWLG